MYVEHVGEKEHNVGKCNTCKMYNYINIEFITNSLIWETGDQ